MSNSTYNTYRNIRKNKAIKLVVFSLIFLSSLTNIQAANPSVSITANGASDNLGINQGDTFTIAWVSSDVVACNLTRNGEDLGGVNVSDSVGPIDANHLYYPTATSSATFAISCTDGTDTFSSSVVVSINAPNSPPPPPPASPAPQSTTLNAPTITVATSAQCGGQIDISWQSVSGATFYNINRDGSQISTTSNLSFTDTGLVPDSAHTYTVSATDGIVTSNNSSMSSVFASSACPSGASGTVQTTSFNTDPADYPTISVSNYSQNPLSISNWSPSVNLQPGEILSVGIYYHNAGSVDAVNTTVSILVPTGSSASFIVSGGVSADNASAVGGSATANIAGSESLTYIPGSAVWYPNQIQDPSQGVSLSSYSPNNIGTIVPGWPSQGMVVARFQVSNSSSTSTPISAPVLTGSTGVQCGGNISLSWNSVSGAISYKIFRDNSLITTVSNNSFTDTGLVAGSSHSYYVVASNGISDSVPSNTANLVASLACTSVPSAPTGVTVVTGIQCGGQIDISWSSVANASFYKILRDGTLISTTSNLSFTNTGLNAGQTYSYSIIAVNSIGDSSPSVPAQAVASAVCPSQPPASPILSGGTGAICGGQVALNWTAVSGATSYTVFRGGSQINATTNLSFTDTGLTSGQTYSYTVRALNSFGSSTDSNIVSAVASSVCGGGGGGNPAPTVTLIPVPPVITAGATSTLSWTSTNATSCSALGGWTALTSVSGSQIVSLATTTSFTLTCTGAGGTATSTAIVTVTLPTAPPSVPTNLVANTGAQCGGQIDLSWNTALGATFYNVFRSGTFVASTTNLSFTDTGLTFGQSYSYTIQAGNSFGTSTNSNTASASASSACGSGTGGGGGGGGSSSGGGGSSSGGGRVLSTTGGGIFQCNYLIDYLRIDFQNNPVEVTKLQIFLRDFEKENLSVTGIFDQATFDATSRFQAKYQDDILSPWGYAEGESTGYVYILTKKKINEIVCKQILSLTTGQLQEISEFNSFLSSLQEGSAVSPEIRETILEGTGTPTSTKNIISRITDNPNVKALASAVFATPQGFRNTLKAIFTFLLVLIAAYVVAEELIKRFLKTTDKDNERLRRLAIVLGFLAGAIAVSSILKYFVLILPLVILMGLLVAFFGWIIWKKRNKKGVLVQNFRMIPPQVIITPPPAKQS